jgi:hypothetical protein
MSVTQLPVVPDQTIRRGELAGLIQVLRDRHAQKIDVVLPTNLTRSYGGNLLVGGLDEIEVPEQPAKLTATGVT